jgi:hypothetical protein
MNNFVFILRILLHCRSYMVKLVPVCLFLELCLIVNTYKSFLHLLNHTQVSSIAVFLKQCFIFTYYTNMYSRAYVPYRKHENKLLLFISVFFFFYVIYVYTKNVGTLDVQINHHDIKKSNYKYIN